MADAKSTIKNNHNEGGKGMKFDEAIRDELRMRVILPLWFNIYRDKYLAAKLDLDDFESTAWYEIAKAWSDYDETKSRLTTYFNRVVANKANTELRDWTSRDKRMALSQSTSLNVPIGDEDGMELMETIPDLESDNYGNIERVHEYLTSLSHKQLLFLFLEELGFSEEDIRGAMNLSTSDAYNIVKKLQRRDRVQALTRR